MDVESLVLRERLEDAGRDNLAKGRGNEQCCWLRFRGNR